MKTIKFYFQTTLETIVTIIFIGLAIVAVDFLSELSLKHKYSNYRALELKLNPGALDFARFRQPFDPKKMD